MYKTFFKILGINHTRYVGISKKDGRAYDFYTDDVDQYRPAETEDEVYDCQMVAMWYQADCDRFGTGHIQEDLMTPISPEILYEPSITEVIEE